MFGHSDTRVFLRPWAAATRHKSPSASGRLLPSRSPRARPGPPTAQSVTRSWPASLILAHPSPPDQRPGASVALGPLPGACAGYPGGPGGAEIQRPRRQAPASAQLSAGRGRGARPGPGPVGNATRVAPGIWTVASSRGPRRARSRGGAWGGTSSVELSPACRKDSEEVCWWVLNLCRFNGPAHFSRRIPPGAPGGDG